MRTPTISSIAATLILCCTILYSTAAGIPEARFDANQDEREKQPPIAADKVNNGEKELNVSKEYSFTQEEIEKIGSSQYIGMVMRKCPQTKK